jgi:hypothetical protein
VEVGALTHLPSLSLLPRAAEPISSKTSVAIKLWETGSPNKTGIGSKDGMPIAGCGLDLVQIAKLWNGREEGVGNAAKPIGNDPSLPVICISRCHTGGGGSSGPISPLSER